WRLTSPGRVVWEAVMRRGLVIAITLWAAGAGAEEPSPPETPRAAVLEALEVQAGLPESLPELPEAASPVAESARETATQGARRKVATRREAVEQARKEASKRALRREERVPPGASVRAARAAALDVAGAGSEAHDAAGRSRAEAVRKNKVSEPDGPGNGRPPQQPAPIRRP
ncbi:MAG TPA: hypothetical protein VLQ93_00470, partial [Myxococcaceae bacterium]|nr:hypothetical protein [Myxococcaceae bacterium]